MNIEKLAEQAMAYTAEELVSIAATMRNEQKEYFRTKNPYFLTQAIYYEKTFDSALAIYLEQKKQPTLFE